MEIIIPVKNRIAYSPTEKIICGNSDYSIVFQFDAEWDEYRAKTARFVFADKYIDVVFEGNVCPCPVLSNVLVVAVGVFAGDLCTTTPALIGCLKSILCGGGVPADPSEDVYNQIMALLNGGATPEGGSVLPPVTAEDNGKFLKVVDGAWKAAELPVYEGAYEVTPSATEDQTLLTAQKYMDADVKIEKIPYAEVSNNTGGTTVTIGGN